MADGTLMRRRYLEFQLNELSSENGHHKFEDICREVARVRIASNVVPATGPVSDGGDGGRDFETFPSYLVTELGQHSAFVAHLTDKSLAFACTLQRDDVERKFAKDVATIAALGDSFDHVYAMCAIPVPVGHRNKLRDRVRSEHDLDLVLLDGKWLAEQLAEPDLFWVAEAYLSVPAHMAPSVSPGQEGDGVPEWYRDDLAKWTERDGLRPTLGDLLDAKDGLRFATDHPLGHTDLSFWLELIEPLTTSETPLVVRQRGRYEYIMATLRGRGELRPVDGMVRAYLAEPLADDGARLKDASVVLHSAVGAYARNITDLTVEYLEEANERLRAHLHILLNAGPYPNERARLLDVLGYLALQLDPRRLAPPVNPVPVAVGEFRDEAGNFRAPTSREPAPADAYVAAEEGIAVWSELAAGLTSAPIFPVDELSLMVNLLTPMLLQIEGCASSSTAWMPQCGTPPATARRPTAPATARCTSTTRAGCATRSRSCIKPRSTGSLATTWRAPCWRCCSSRPSTGDSAWSRPQSSTHWPLVSQHRRAATSG